MLALKSLETGDISKAHHELELLEEEEDKLTHELESILGAAEKTYHEAAEFRVDRRTRNHDDVDHLFSPCFSHRHWRIHLHRKKHHQTA